MPEIRASLRVLGVDRGRVIKALGRFAEVGSRGPDRSWFLRSECALDASLEAHLAWLLERVRGREAALRALSSDGDVSILATIALDEEGDGPRASALSVPSELAAAMGSAGIRLDMYVF